MPVETQYRLPHLSGVRRYNFNPEIPQVLIVGRVFPPGFYCRPGRISSAEDTALRRMKFITRKSGASGALYWST